MGRTRRPLHNDAGGRVATRGVGIVLLTLVAGCGSTNFLGNREFRSTPAAIRGISDDVFADERRVGINVLVKLPEGQEPPYPATYRKLAGADPDWLVRATAVRAMNRSKDGSPEATGVYLAALSDVNARVRLEGAKAFKNYPSDRAVPRLIELLNDAQQDRDVRVACAVALGRTGRTEVARVLVAALAGRDFGVAYESRLSLKRMTGKDFHYDDGLWLKWLTGSAQPFKSPAATGPSK